MQTRIYLDNAATSWPKHESVYLASNDVQRYLGAPAGRGNYKKGAESSRLVDQTRNLIAQRIQAPAARNVAFTFSGTDALCTAIFGILKSGDHVVTSTAEHNSVLRPLRHLEQQEKISVSRVNCDLAGQISAADIINAINPATRLVVLSHVSNVTGAIQPLTQIGDYCRDADILFLVDAAQSVGHLPIDVRELKCDLLAAPGHKGLLGPLGTGFLFYTDRAGELLMPLRYGGTGSVSNTDDQPSNFPEKFESGNLNVPGIAGLGAGIAFLNSCEGGDCWEASVILKEKLWAGLQLIDDLTLHGPTSLNQRVGVFSIALPNLDCHDAAAILDSNWSIQTRAGFHCAPLLHRTLGTESAGGTLRISLGFFNTPQQIETTLDALAELMTA